MFDRETARRLADGVGGPDVVIDDDGVRELSTGWFFPYRAAGEALVVGSQGVIVNKRTGKLFKLGSAFPVERDLRLYDQGYQFSSYDLVITAVRDLEDAVKVLRELRLSVVVPEYEGGTVWRIPRALTEGEIKKHLSDLPTVFPQARLYYVIEHLEDALRSGVLKAEVLEAPE